MLALPAPTPFDLRFRLFGFPIRISPWFWLVTLMMGSASFARGDLGRPAAWMACVLGSILVHELGHGVMGRLFGDRPEIILYWMGGLCVPRTPREGPRQRLAVLLMGPGAQLLLLGVIFLVGRIAWGIPWRADWLLIRNVLGISSLLKPSEADAAEAGLALARMSPLAFYAFYQLIHINLLWALLNLLPILPLDGGQVAQVLLTEADRVHGARRAHIVSMITAGLAAAFLASRMSGEPDMAGLYPVIFFGTLALMNYQQLQAHHDHYLRNGPDDADWWKR